MSEKNQKPTPQRLRDARKKGDVPRSSELTRAFVLVGCLIWLGFGMAGLMQSLMVMLKSAISNPDLLALPSPQAALALLQPHLLGLFLPPLVLVIVFSLLGDFLQVRGVFSLEPLLPKLDNLNPAQGFERIFALRTLVHLGFSLLMIVLILFSAVVLIKLALHDLASLTQRPSWHAASVAAWLLFKLLAVSALVHLLVAVMDVMYQQFDYLQRQRMSIDELRREHKENEGDPHMRARRRAIARSPD